MWKRWIKIPNDQQHEEKSIHKSSILAWKQSNIEQRNIEWICIREVDDYAHYSCVCMDSVKDLYWQWQCMMICTSICMICLININCKNVIYSGSNFTSQFFKCSAHSVSNTARTVCALYVFFQNVLSVINSIISSKTAIWKQHAQSCTTTNQNKSSILQQKNSCLLSMHQCHVEVY